MALSDIVQKINDEANKKAAFMKQVADGEIKKIKEETEVKSENRKKEIEESTKQKCKSAIEKARILAKMEGNSSFLKEKREVIDQTYDKVEMELNGLSDSDYIKLIVKMLKSASVNLNKGELIIPKDKKRQTEEAISKAGVSYHIKGETSDFKGGFIVISSKSEINLSFPYLLEKIVRPKTELETARILFN